LGADRFVVFGGRGRRGRRGRSRSRPIQSNPQVF
jgi:hypothetical protein